jgi:restriction endonuclease Mrr
MFSTKYFYDEANLEAFREEYAEMPIHQKAMENTLLVAGGALVLIAGLFGLLVVSGVV